MTTPSQFDPLAQTPHSIRGRIARKLGRTIEPMAVNLLAWCRSLDHRATVLERRFGEIEARAQSLDQSIRSIESRGATKEALEDLAGEVAVLAKRSGDAGERLSAVEGKLGRAEPRIDRVEARVSQVDGRVDQCFWGREALVDRMNLDDAREAQYAERLAAVEARSDQLAWGREALVERMNRDDATVEAIDRRLDEVRKKVEEQLPLPLSFGLDYLAMGRRLAALEDQVESLLGDVARSREVRSATLVAHPVPGPERAAG